MSLEGLNLASMTEKELRDLKRERALAFLPIHAEYRNDALKMQSFIDIVQQARYAEYNRVAGNSPSAISVEIGGV